MITEIEPVLQSTLFPLIIRAGYNSKDKKALTNVLSKAPFEVVFTDKSGHPVVWKTEPRLDADHFGGNLLLGIGVLARSLIVRHGEPETIGTKDNPINSGSSSDTAALSTLRVGAAILEDLELIGRGAQELLETYTVFYLKQAPYFPNVPEDNILRLGKRLKTLDAVHFDTNGQIFAARKETGQIVDRNGQPIVIRRR